MVMACMEGGKLSCFIPGQLTACGTVGLALRKKRDNAIVLYRIITVRQRAVVEDNSTGRLSIV